MYIIVSCIFVRCIFVAIERRRIEETTTFPIAKGDYLIQYAEKIKEGLIPYELKVSSMTVSIAL